VGGGCYVRLLFVRPTLSAQTNDMRKRANSSLTLIDFVGGVAVSTVSFDGVVKCIVGTMLTHVPVIGLMAAEATKRCAWEKDEERWWGQECDCDPVSGDVYRIRSYLAQSLA
jgi:hypothetical protein